jgi:hypothetical protein
MKDSRFISARALRLSLLPLLALSLFVGTAFWGGVNVSANHPVLLEGNCDSPVPGTTIVAAGTCGDFDGDTRIGTAEDTDGADRIFGTLEAALGPGTGAAAGTGANQNGAILIVTSGRFSESVLIGNPLPGFPGGSATPGNVTIEAAPGVIANIDAVFQGDPVGGNTSRQATTGIAIFYPDPATNDRVVTLRNLILRNWNQGVGASSYAKILIDNCRFENNLRSGITAAGPATNMVIARSQFQGNGRRIPVSGPPNPGDGLLVEEGASVKISDSLFSNNAGAGIRNSTGFATRVTLFKVATYFNGTDIVGPVTISPNPNYSNE